MGNCADQAHLTVALLRAVNIPAKYSYGGNHAWVNIYLPDAKAEFGVSFHTKDYWRCAEPNNDPNDKVWGKLVTLKNKNNKVDYKGNQKLGWHIKGIYDSCVRITGANLTSSHVLNKYKLIQESNKLYVAFQYITLNGVEKQYWF
jgi:hypothetical protein